MDAAHPSPEGDQPRTSRLAIASIVLGVLSLGLSVFTSIPGLICGIRGFNRITASEAGAPGPRLSGRGLALAGIILNALTTIVTPVLFGLLLPAIMAARSAALRQTSELKQVSFAMQMAVDAWGDYPVDVLDADGKPLLSWRVAILPFLGDEGKQLFDEFRLDEPWDSDHNKALIPRMPAVYAAAGTVASQGLTGVMQPAGPGSFGQPEATLRFDDATFAVVHPKSVTDGLSNTVFLMCIPGVQIPWTQPTDWADDPTKLFALLRQDGVLSFVVATADCAVHTLGTDLPDDNVTAIFSRAGGDVGTFSGD